MSSPRFRMLQFTFEQKIDLLCKKREKYILSEEKIPAPLDIKWSVPYRQGCGPSWYQAPSEDIGAGPGPCNDLRQWAINLKKSNILIGAFRGIPSRNRFINNILCYLQP